MKIDPSNPYPQVEMDREALLRIESDNLRVFTTGQKLPPGIIVQLFSRGEPKAYAVEVGAMMETTFTRIYSIEDWRRLSLVRVTLDRAILSEIAHFDRKSILLGAHSVSPSTADPPVKLHGAMPAALRPCQWINLGQAGSQGVFTRYCTQVERVSEMIWMVTLERENPR